MNPSLIYAAVAGGIAASLLVLQFSRYIYHFHQRTVSVLLLRHLVYPLLIDGHALVGPWTRGVISLQLLYWITTIFCSTFRVSSLAEAATRTGTLSLVNLVPLYFGFHLAFIADLLGVSLRLWKGLHGSIGVVAFVLAVAHATIHLATGERGPPGARSLFSILASLTAPLGYVMLTY